MKPQTAIITRLLALTEEVREPGDLASNATALAAAELATNWADAIVGGSQGTASMLHDVDEVIELLRVWRAAVEANPIAAQQT